jgi:hypothetical protein
MRLNNISKSPYIVIIGVIASMATIIGVIVQNIQSGVNIQNSNLSMSPILQGKNLSVNYEVNENKIIPYSHKIQIDLDPSGISKDFGERVKGLKNIKYLLPNNKIAFIKELKLGEKIIIAYTNEDCSEVKVTDKYEDSIVDEEVCFVISLECRASYPLLRKIKNNSSCFIN